MSPTPGHKEKAAWTAAKKVLDTAKAEYKRVTGMISKAVDGGGVDFTDLMAQQTKVLGKLGAAETEMAKARKACKDAGVDVSRVAKRKAPQGGAGGEGSKKKKAKAGSDAGPTHANTCTKCKKKSIPKRLKTCKNENCWYHRGG